MSDNTLEFEGTTYLDGRASDPKTLQLMEGSPVPNDRVVSDDRYLDFPGIRWGVSHVRELRPTVNVRRGDCPAPLPECREGQLGEGLVCGREALFKFLSRECCKAFNDLTSGGVYCCN
jgi:hypothetical protein